jgi:hypothetical protein
MRVVTLLLTAVICLDLSGIAEAAKKKKPSGNSAPTAEQRKKMYKEGLEWCRKKVGAQIHYVRIEKKYGKWSFVCYHY